MKIQMPKSCVSCTFYAPKGHKADVHTPFKDRWNENRSVQYGFCSKHSKEVFCTEICVGYDQDKLIDVFPVANRPEPMNPHQEKLF